MIDRVEKTFLPTIEILAKNREKHLNPSQTTKSHFCPIIDIMLNSVLKEILHRTDSQIIKLLTLN